MSSDRTPVLQQVLEGVGEMLGPFPIEASLQLKERGASLAGGVDLHCFCASPPTTESACFTRSGRAVECPACRRRRD